MKNSNRKIIVPGKTNRNLNVAVSDSFAELNHLQKQRTKANKSRKAYWQSKVDAHFGLK